MFGSLRRMLIVLWLFLATTSVVLAILIWHLSKLSEVSEISRLRSAVNGAAQAIKDRFVNYKGTSADTGDRRGELLLLLDLVLKDYSGIEGGFWDQQSGFVAYRFPTYEGGTIKTDVPAAEEGRITDTNKQSLSQGSRVFREYRTADQTLQIVGLPVSKELCVWTMGRVHLAQAAGLDQLNLAFGVLLALVLCSATVIFFLIQRLNRDVTRLETFLAQDNAWSQLPPTGLRELDRLVEAHNRQSRRLAAAQAEAEQLTRELERREKLAALGSMAAGLAHEIRNPIGAMRLHAEAALVRTDSELVIRPVRLILDDIARLDDLLVRLLAVGQLQKLNVAEVLVRDWLENVAARNQEIAPWIKFDVNAPGDPWRFDRLQMDRALDNLVKNALQHLSGKGWISLEAQVLDHRLRVAVEDSGPGVPENIRARIFEPFTSFRLNGTGLGLAVTREIIEAHGGSIRYEAGKIGARFVVDLPWLKS